MRAYVADRRTGVETVLTCIFRRSPMRQVGAELTPPLVSSGPATLPTIGRPRGR